MDVQFDEREMSALISQAILEGMGPGNRDLIITSAIAHLMKTPQNHYGGVPLSPLQKAFNTALDKYVTTAVESLLETDEELRSTVETAITQMMGSFTALRNDMDLRTKVTETVVNYLVERRSYDDD